MIELAIQVLFCIAEFDTISKRLAQFGPSAITPEDFDYEPGTFIPDDVPDGSPGDIASSIEAMSADEPRPMYERATHMLKSFKYKFDPASLLNSAAQQEILQDLMLAKLGYLSAFSLCEKMGITNFAPPDMEIPPDEIGRLALQQKLGLGMTVNAQGRTATDQTAPHMEQNANGPTLATS